MLSSAYRLLTDLGGPVIHLYLRKRMAQGKEDELRFSERLGIASQPRPEGRVIWCHAASVGEASSFLALIERLLELYPDVFILVTTGTVTSARMLEGRLPKGVVHQYVPVDRLAFIVKFLNHWRPDLCLWIELELWPNMLAELRRRRLPAVLLNGKISARSFRHWYRVKSWSSQILASFALCVAQTEEDRSRLVALGARRVRYIGNLKYAAKPLPFDILAYGDLKAAIGDRPLWLMASSHRGEEELAIAAHLSLRQKWPDLLTIIVPRHAVRGTEVAQKISESKLTMARRSLNQVITSATEIYLADTMGELGLFYRLSRIMCMGGSFVDVGGHNPIEPAQLGCAIIFGPYMQSFSEVAPEFIAHRAAIPLANADEMSSAIHQFLASAELRDSVGYAARVLADQKRDILEKTIAALEPWTRGFSQEAEAQ